MMSETYWINPKKGIYYTEKAYHDDIDYIYVVDFDKSDVKKQFEKFIEMIKRDGAKENMVKLKRDFSALKDLLS
jgi:hypothetical protein